MELPKTKREFLVDATKFALRSPFLYLSYLCDRPINLSPLSVDINITDRCNFWCKMCRGLNKNYKAREDMDFATMKKIVDQMKEMHILYLTLGGGESLLRHDFVLETVRYATNLGIRVGITTNGSLLDETGLLKLCDGGLHRIAFSLDGASQETHDEIRMPGSYNKIMSLLDLIQRLRRENSLKCRIHINTVIMKQNFRELLEIAHIARRFNATLFFNPVDIPQVLDQVSNSGRASADIQPLIINGDELSELEVEMRQLVDFRRECASVGNLTWQLLNVANYFRSLEAGKSLIKSTCYAGFNTIHIDSNGDFLSCVFMPTVGNVHSVSLKEAWHSEDYNNHRKLIKHCTRPCSLGCYYPVHPLGLVRDFLYLPAIRKMSAFRK